MNITILLYAIVLFLRLLSTERMVAHSPFSFPFPGLDLLGTQ